jgi:hypothetical protein
MRRPAAALALLLTAAPAVARAEEGMWTFNGFPRAAVEKAYGFKVTDGWLDDVRLASVRLAQGCSGSFVSGSGLVMTNHHCAHGCIEQLSTPAKDFVKSGFYAKAPADEVKCPEIEVNQLVAITDVTARLQKATAGKSGPSFFQAQRAEQAAIEKACQTSDELRCDVVSLFHGGRYDLYAYRRFQDVRLVFAPEFAIAFFGGDPDNFTFPRYDLDVAFLRVYQGGKPAATPHHFGWSAGGPKEGELTFVSGHPGGTSRQLTVAQLADQRDEGLPERLVDLAELRGELLGYQRRGEEQTRHSNSLRFFAENSYKAVFGRWKALLDQGFFAGKVKAEADLKKALAADPKRAEVALPAFEAIAKATAEARALAPRTQFVERLSGGGDLLFLARGLTRAAAERAKPNGERLREYADAALPAIRQELLAPTPIYPELEIFRQTRLFTRMRERLGADDPFVKKVLGKQSPEELAEALVKGTTLGDVAVRQKLWDGGAPALAEAVKGDALLAFAARVDEDGRALRKRREETIDPVVTKSGELLAKARFEVQGAGTYPDATFTLRLSYGAVKGYREGERQVAPFTTLGGAFERATGREPFALPSSWLEAEGRLDKRVPFNFASDNDIIGGNSGSPVVNARKEVVGLIFDGNLQSLGGEYGFDASVNRAVAVDSAALLEALDKIYRAERIVKELQPGRK